MSRVLKNYADLITSPFGTRTLNGVKQMHYGTDLVGQGHKVDDIIAIESGTVVEVVNNVSGFTTSKPRGNYILIDHGNGFKTRYQHLARVLIAKGQVINKGTTLGTMGATGEAYGAHLHFEVIKNGSCIDPQPYLTGVQQIMATRPTVTTDIKVGDTVKVKTTATKFTTGQTIASFVKNNKYDVIQVKADRILIGKGKVATGWVYKTDVERV